MEDFAKMELQEIQDNIRSRRNKIFLQMEEVSIKTKLAILLHAHNWNFYVWFDDV